jgi:ligand-binding sensor domain-containing protein
MRYSGIILFVLVFLFKTQAQELSYREYNTNHGMAQNQIVAWMQDRDGYIWFGHKAGVSRFDGMKFDTFSEKDGLPDVFISTITQCPDGKIYVLTRKGFALFDGEKFTPYPYDRDDILFRHWNYNDFITFHLSDDWIVTISADVPILFKHGRYYSFDYLFPGISLGDKLPFRFSEDGKSFLSHNKNGLWLYRDNDFIPVYENSPGLHWFLTANENIFGCQSQGLIYLFNRNTLDLDTVYSLPINHYQLVNYIDEQGNVYIIESPSMLHIISPDDHWQTFQFSIPFINSIFRDREHNYWIFGETGALMLQSLAFRNFTRLHGAPDYVWTLLEDVNGIVWFASYGQGLYFYNGNTFQKKNVSGLPTHPGRDRFYKGSIRDEKNRLWFPHNNGVVRIENGRGEMHPGVPDEFTLYAYQCPYTGDLFFAQVGQVAKLNSDNKVEVTEIKPGNKEGLLLCLTMDTLKRLWIGGPYGISILDGDSMIHLPTEDLHFSTGAVSLVTDHKGNIWIGNRSGLFFYDYREVRQIMDKNFFLDKYVTDLKVAGSDGLFIGMVGGMAWLNLERFYRDIVVEIDFFDQHNGFLGREVLQNGSCVASDGTIWISANDRVVHFDPSKRKNRNHSQPNLKILNISTLNGSMEWESLDMYDDPDKSLMFRYYQEHIRFDFAGITMVNPENVKYRYKLKGLSEEWSVSSGERYASFTYLPPGRYTFMVDVSNAEGEWSGQPAVISFMIRRAWWQTAGFRISAAILVIAIITGIAYLIIFRIRQHRMNEMNMHRHIAELRLEAIKAQVEPHFIFNVLSSIGSSIYNNRKEEAYTSLTRFSRLIRRAFEGNEKPYGELSTEISFTENYLELQKQRFKDAFDYKIHVDHEVPGNALLPRLLLQTLTENAIKHGVLPAGSERVIEIYVNKKADHYEIIVEDNGVGRQQANPDGNGSTGKGLHITRQLFDIFNQFNDRKITFDIVDKLDKDQAPAGTKVIVTIPDDFQFEIPEAGFKNP